VEILSICGDELPLTKIFFGCVIFFIFLKIKICCKTWQKKLPIFWQKIIGNEKNFSQCNFSKFAVFPISGVIFKN
jgi:hypothetical protein